uniref:Leucine-rich repeat-containing N-terminal plant-type domain-containing protein n=1 Tax=Odontella aurita TaxID=265563 RepID=A0A7S4IS60_9STRA|mmetsp:Transcript_29559/g.87558  ORF Transcript_29559/g.87558 Transcript_29559/m.87558 type:complete len:553 (+) Transcript_29559:274-1932(+)
MPSSTRTAALALLLGGGASALSEMDSLVRFYNLVNGRHWVNGDGWSQASEAAADDTKDVPAEYASVCSWHGITCDDDDTVSEIDLSYNHLSGKVSHHLWTLPNLKVANLHGNLITDAGLVGYESTDSAPKSPLHSLFLSENRLTSLEGIGSVPTTLRELHIGSNAFEGHFPEEIFRLKKLRALRASYNAGITGTLSTEIGRMTSLKELQLSYTGLKGAVPTEIGNLAEMEFLALDENRMKGTIPFELEDLTKLRYLSIQNGDPDSEKLTGKVPSFKDCADLKELQLGDNALTGTVPSDLLEFSLLTDKPVVVGLRNNKLSGRIPSDLSRFDKLHLEVGGNRINGISSSLCSKDKWMTGAVKEFGCDAILCPKGTFRAESGRREGDTDQCEDCPNGVEDAPHFGSTSCDGGGGASSTAATSDGTDAGEGSGGGSSSGTPYKPPAEKAAVGSSSSVKSASSSSSSSSSSGGMSGGAAFAVALVALVGFLGLALMARRQVLRRRGRREAMEDAEYEKAARDGVVFDAADAGATSDMLTDVPLEGQASADVNRCIL